MSSSSFQDVARRIDDGMVGEPVTLLDFEDVRSALFLSGQSEMGQFLADKGLQMIRLLGILGKRYADQAPEGSVAGMDLWDSLCIDRHAMLARFPKDDELALLVLLHQEMSNFCKSVRLHALQGAGSLRTEVLRSSGGAARVQPNQIQ